MDAHYKFQRCLSRQHAQGASQAGALGHLKSPLRAYLHPLKIFGSTPPSGLSTRPQKHLLKSLLMKQKAYHMFDLKHVLECCLRLKLYEEYVCESTEGRKKQGKRQRSCCDPSRAAQWSAGQKRDSFEKSVEE